MSTHVSGTPRIVVSRNDGGLYTWDDVSGRGVRARSRSLVASGQLAALAATVVWGKGLAEL